ncbi:hypothetical protein [Aquimarina litoralis]|uniref:hypothetical protein n=1 Tax=Aquimarina litoralis TaxID=584605 RepID=UPI001C5672A1|nr:hypothetical protein [Aquimarina litoralis]MBW1298894.1 hypothetical protein [Aquimarina litoralis]
MQKICFLVLLIPFLNYSQENWDLVKNKDQIKIWVRDVADSPFKEYKATTIIDTALDNVLDELLTAPAYMNNCQEGISHLIKVTNKKEYLFYVRNEFPWPIKNRDVVSKINVQEISKNIIKLNIDAAPKQLPILKNTLRVQELSGFWLLENQGDHVKITQQLYINPEGTLPPFITNTLLISGPFRTFTELRNKLENVDS